MRDDRGFNPFAVYGMLFVLAVLWCAVAGLLAAVGPGGAFLLAALLCVAPLLVSGARKARAQRVTGGLCGGGGYDLRASEERCPECGSPLADEIRRRRRLVSGDERALTPPAVFRNS